MTNRHHHLPAPPAARQPGALAISSLILHLLNATACAGVCIYVFMTISVAVPPLLLVLLLVALWFAAVIKPTSPAPLILILLAIVLRLFAVPVGAASLDGSVLLLTALLPVTHQLAALAAGIPATGKFEWSAVRPSVVRCVVTVLAFELPLILLLAFE